MVALAATPHHGRTDLAPKPVRYRLVDDGDDKKPSRHRVVYLRGFEGYVVRWSQHCSGCTETPEYTASPDRGEGCHECGYTGRSRRSWFIAFDEWAFQQWSEARYERGERLRRHFEQRKREQRRAS